MISSRASFAPVVRGSCRRLVSGLSIVVATCALSATALAQPADGAAAEGGRGRRGGQGQNGERGGRGNFDPAEAQARQLAALREQFGITDDAEWGLISDRITKVIEARGQGGRGGGRGGFAVAGGPGGFAGGGGGGGRGNRATGNPEVDALRAALNDKLPDAEIKSRLERLRDARKADEARMEKAQEDLRAVLNVRQEAFAVMMGLLP
jgi:Spy/CpxP family protein refolding chaperone